MKTHTVSETLPLFPPFPAAERGDGSADAPLPDGQEGFAQVLAASLVPIVAASPLMGQDSGNGDAAGGAAGDGLKSASRSQGTATALREYATAPGAAVTAALLSMAQQAHWPGDDRTAETLQPAPAQAVIHHAAFAPASDVPAAPTASEVLRRMLAQDDVEEALLPALASTPGHGIDPSGTVPPVSAQIAAATGFAVAAIRDGNRGVPTPLTPDSEIPAATTLSASRPAAEPSDSQSYRLDSPPDSESVDGSVPPATIRAASENEPSLPVEGMADGLYYRAMLRDAVTNATGQPSILPAVTMPTPAATNLASSRSMSAARPIQDATGPGANIGIDTNTLSESQGKKTAPPMVNATTASPLTSAPLMPEPIASLATDLGATAAVSTKAQPQTPAATARLRFVQDSLATSRLLAAFDAVEPSQDRPQPVASPSLPATDRVGSADGQSLPPAGALPAAPGAQIMPDKAGSGAGAANPAETQRETQALAKPPAAQTTSAAPLLTPASLPPVTEVEVAKVEATEVTATEDTGGPLAVAPPDRAAGPERFDATAPAGQLRGASPHNLAQQLAQALPEAADRPVELTLSPEELGKVRMTLHTTNASITVSVLAERPETLDLMRRNIDSLARDFRDMGYSNITFDFGQQPGRHPAPQDHPGFAEHSETEPPIRFETASLAVQPAANNATGGLDLRI